ncbi:MAG: hypothetical protein ACTSUH_00735, partial [Candidatus Thorarchaeota archaeon]
MRRTQIAILSILTVLVLVPVLSASNTIDVVQTPLSPAGLYLENGGHEVAASQQDQASWWNVSFIYRRYLNITEPNVYPRTQIPVHLYLTFELGHCYRNSMRVLYYNNPSWTELPFQIWNTTYDTTGNYILSTRVTFLANVSQNETEKNYYVYYSKNDVGSVSYPDFYPFVYKSYT